MITLIPCCCSPDASDEAGLLRDPAFFPPVAQYFSDEAYRGLQVALLENPEAGDLIPGTGGFRKMRWEDTRRGKGNRGGLRVIYYYLTADRQIWLFTLYDKGEAADLAPVERRALQSAISAELKARTESRRTRR